LHSAACGACLFASVASGTTTTPDATCEESLTVNCVPVISSISPATAAVAGGDVITLQLNNNPENLNDVSVTVDGSNVAATVTGSTVTFTAPAHAAGAVNVVVTANGQTSEPVVLTYA